MSKMTLLKSNLIGLTIGFLIGAALGLTYIYSMARSLGITSHEFNQYDIRTIVLAGVVSALLVGFLIGWVIRKVIGS